MQSFSRLWKQCEFVEHIFYPLVLDRILGKIRFSVHYWLNSMHSPRINRPVLLLLQLHPFRSIGAIHFPTNLVCLEQQRVKLDRIMVRFRQSAVDVTLDLSMRRLRAKLVLSSNSPNSLCSICQTTTVFVMHKQASFNGCVLFCPRQGYGCLVRKTSSVVFSNENRFH